MSIRVCFIYDPQLNEDGVSAYMDLDTTFGVKIAAVCAALGWRVRDWDFFFGPYDAARWSPSVSASTGPPARSTWTTPTKSIFCACRLLHTTEMF